MAKAKILKFPTSARRETPRWAKRDDAGWTVKFKSGKRPSLARAAKEAQAAKAAEATQERPHPAEDDMDERLMPSIPHYWDLMVIREVIGWPDLPMSYATQEERKVAESKAMAAQKRILRNFSVKYEEISKRCNQLEKEVRRLRAPSEKSTSGSRSRKS